jgi:hypothetical protein
MSSPPDRPPEEDPDRETEDTLKATGKVLAAGFLTVLGVLAAVIVVGAFLLFLVCSGH